MRCVECRQKSVPWTRQHVVEFSLCQHPICVFSSPCRDVHTATCPPYCRSVGRKPTPHPRDLAKQAKAAAEPEQLGLFV